MEEQTVKCTRDNCDTDIPLIKDNLVVLRPEVPLLSAKCPECGKTRVLTKDISIDLVRLYFKDEFDDFDETGELSELDDVGCNGPLMPSKDLSKLVEETLELLGYKGKKWKDKVKAIVEFVKSGSTYQTPQGLHQLLAAWKIDVQHIPMIVEKVFGTTDNIGQMPQYGNLQNIGGQMPNYQGTIGAQPSPIGAGYSLTQAPNGQVIVLPPPTPPTSKRTPDSDDTIIIEEKVGGKGQVVSRVIKQKGTPSTAPAAEEKGSIEAFASMVKMLKDMGVIGDKSEPAPAPPAVSPEVAQTLERMNGVLNSLSNTQSSMGAERSDRDSDVTRQYEKDLKELNDEIKQMRDDRHNEEIASLRREMGSMRENMSNTSPTGLNDLQFAIDAKQKNLSTLTTAMESTGSKLIEPLIEMQTMQAKLNGMLAIRQLELTDQVPAGTYARAMAPSDNVPDEEVKDKLKMWKERAGGDDSNLERP